MHLPGSVRLTLLFVILGCTAILVPVSVTAAPIRIGALITATGDNAAPGQNVHDGIQLAVEEINKRGGLNGSRLEITFADSGTDAQSAADAFAKMEAAVHPVFYLSYSSTVGMALAPLAETYQVVLLGLVTSAVDFTRNREWVFRYWPLGPSYIAPLLRILQDLKARRIGILYQDDDFGREQQDLMTRGFILAGGSVLVRPFEIKDTDSSAQIAALKDRDAIYVAASGASIINIVRQLRSARYQGSILVPAGGADPALFVLSEMAGVYVAAPIIHNPGYLYAREAGERFLERYQKPFNQWAANGYDSMKLVCGLLEDRTVTRQAVKDALSGGFEYSGVFGHVRLRSGEHDLTFPMYPTRITNGALIYL